MVICKYFQQGSCHFGSKCHNEHFDVKHILKVDMETAVNGKQWPLSCYGPFKDKICLPNFIEDQSFEEVRFMCYDAKQKNYFEQFYQQFSQKVLEASNKMKSMQTQQMIDIATNIYDTPVADANKPATSIFGSANSNANNTNTNVMMNNVFNTNNNNTQAATGSIFGNTNTNKINPFGNPQQQATSIFGQAVASNQSNNFPFNTNNNNTNIFAQAEKQNTGTGLFASVPPQNASSGEGLFAQAAQQTNNPGYNIFQQQQNASTTSVFGQNVFGQTQPQQQGNNLFMQTQPQPMNAVVSQAGSTIFGQANQSQQPSSNIFSNSPAVAPATTTTVNSGDKLDQQQMQNSSFQKQAMNTEQGQQVSGNTLFSGVYSRMEDLTHEEMEAFKAPMFSPGKIPFSPPPREFLC